MGRECAGELMNIDSFAPFGVGECAVAFTHACDALGRETLRNTVPHHAAMRGNVIQLTRMLSHSSTGEVQ